MVQLLRASRGIIISHLYTKNMIIWCMLTQIWSATDMIFCHFRPFLLFYPNIETENLNLGKKVKKIGNIILLHICTMKIIWCMDPEIQSANDRDFCYFKPLFALWTSLQLKKSKFWKNKKRLCNIILNLCSMNENDMMYGSWDIVCDR